MTASLWRESEETGRLLALSDGVIAIVITLLVLDITVPAVPSGASTDVLPALVLQQWQEFLGFVLSFLVIGLYWILHRRVFVHIERHEKGVVVLNLLFLLVVAFVPFATALFTEYPNRFGVSFLSGVLALNGLTLALLWMYASRRHLVAEGLSSRTVAIQAARFLASPVVFLLSIALAQFDTRIALLSWGLLVPINGLLQSRLAESLETTPKPERPTTEL